MTKSRPKKKKLTKKTLLKKSRVEKESDTPPAYAHLGSKGKCKLNKYDEKFPSHSQSEKLKNLYLYCT